VQENSAKGKGGRSWRGVSLEGETGLPLAREEAAMGDSQENELLIFSFFDHLYTKYSLYA